MDSARSATATPVTRFTLVLFLALSACAGPDTDPPRLSDGLLREAVQALEEGRNPPSSVEMVGTDILVEVIPAESEDAAASAVDRAGGELRDASPGVLLAVVPFDQLEGLEHDDAVDHLRNPLNIEQVP